MFMSNHLVGFGVGSQLGPETIDTLSNAHSAFNGTTIGNVAAQFTPTTGTLITAIYLGGANSGGQAWTPKLYTNSAGSPGTLITTFSNITEVADPSTHDLTGLSQAVTPGTTYWMVWSRTVSTNQISCCTSVGGVVTGAHGTITSIVDQSNITAGLDLRFKIVMS